MSESPKHPLHFPYPCSKCFGVGCVVQQSGALDTMTFKVHCLECDEGYERTFTEQEMAEIFKDAPRKM